MYYIIASVSKIFLSVMWISFRENYLYETYLILYVL